MKSLTSQKSIFEPGNLIVDTETENPMDDLGIVVPFDKVPKKVRDAYLNEIKHLEQNEQPDHIVWAYWTLEKKVLWIRKDKACPLKDFIKLNSPPGRNGLKNE